jgi:hypothetical protein
MIDTDRLGKITYNDVSNLPYDATRSYVKSFTIDGRPVDFSDASTYYRVSTVNYLAAGSCNFNDNGVSLWPLNQIVNDTQYYVRDAVIDYVTKMGSVSPAIEGRLVFQSGDLTAPAITVTRPTASSYLHNAKLTPTFSAIDDNSGLASVTGNIDGKAVASGVAIDLRTLALGTHTFTATAVDVAGNSATKSVSFKVVATIASVISEVKLYRAEGKITKAFATRLLGRLEIARSRFAKGQLSAAVVKMSEVVTAIGYQSGHAIKTPAAKVLTNDCIWVMKDLKKIAASLRK